MSSRLVVAAIVTALSIGACGPTPPTTAPAPTGQAALTTPAPSPSTSPDDALRIDDAAYLAGVAFTVAVGEAGAEWTAPSDLPVMPNGQPAARVAFLPASCGTGNFTITADAAPADPWVTGVRADGDAYPYTMESWPAAQIPECANGQVWTYLEVGYRPFAPRGTIHVVASLANIKDAPSAVEVVPVFTSAGATQPSLTASGLTIMLGPVTGGPIPPPDKPRGAKAQAIFTGDFVRLPLPDGTTPTRWGFRLTGCGPVGPNPIVITARIGSAAPVEVGQCSDGSMSNEMFLPVPADGTHVEVLSAGGTLKSYLRLSEFQWRGNRN